MWTPFNNTIDTYEARTEVIATEATKPGNQDGKPVLDMTPEEWNGLLLVTLKPFREAREALVKAIDDKILEKQLQSRPR